MAERSQFWQTENLILGRETAHDTVLMKKIKCHLSGNKPHFERKDLDKRNPINHFFFVFQNKNNSFFFLIIDVLYRSKVLFNGNKNKVAENL